MHIPDHYLSPSTCLVIGAAMIPLWRRASVQVKKELSRQNMPLLGVGAAFSFLLMMFNIPLPGGTTGHAVGASLVAILWGPWFAMLAVSVALFIQALFFGDGGILAFGVNCFNMAFLMPFAASYVFRWVRSRFSGGKAEAVGAFLAGYLAMNVAALAAAVQFGIQPMLFKDSAGLPLYCPYGLETALPAMLIPHLLVAGVLEGLVAAGVYRYLRRVSPELISAGPGPSGASRPLGAGFGAGEGWADRGLAADGGGYASLHGNESANDPEGAVGSGTSIWRRLYAGLVGLAILSPLGLLAVGTAWGEWSPEELGDAAGFIPKGMKEGFVLSTPLPDYSVLGMPEEVGYMLSAFLGLALIALFAKSVSLLAGKRADR